MKKVIILLAIAGLLVIDNANAQTAAAPDTATLNFVTQASLGGLKEIKSGKMAEKKARSAEVKAYGARMVADHSKVNARLMKLVKAKGYKITPPTAADMPDDSMLKDAEGPEFDKNYVTMMVMDHQKTIALFKHAANAVPDAEIKALAAQTLPELQQHLAAIKAIASKMSIPTQTTMK